MKNDYDEEDIILPETILGEIMYVKFVLFSLIKNKENIPLELFKLKRQIRFWLKHKW